MFIYNGTMIKASNTLFAMWLLAMLALPVSHADAEPNNDQKETHYTAVEQRLIDAGFPTTDEHWLSKEFRDATDAILVVAKENPADLPRWNEEGTGLFSRLLDELDSITTALDNATRKSEFAEEYIEAIEHIGPFTSDIILEIWQAYSYMPDGTAMMYEREVLAVLPYLVRGFGLHAKFMSQLEQESDSLDPEHNDQFNKQYLRYQTVSGRTANAMINVTMNPGYKHLDLRASFFINCKQSLIHLIGVMTEKDREEAIFKLDTLMKFTQNPEEREAIGAILGIEVE